MADAAVSKPALLMGCRMPATSVLSTNAGWPSRGNTNVLPDFNARARKLPSPKSSRRRFSGIVHERPTHSGPQPRMKEPRASSSTSNAS